MDTYFLWQRELDDAKSIRPGHERMSTPSQAGSMHAAPPHGKPRRVHRAKPRPSFVGFAAATTPHTLKQGDTIMLEEDGVQRQAKVLRARPAFGPRMTHIQVHYKGQPASSDEFLSVRDPRIRVPPRPQWTGGSTDETAPVMQQSKPPDQPTARRAGAIEEMSQAQVADEVIAAVESLGFTGQQFDDELEATIGCALTIAAQDSGSETEIDEEAMTPPLGVSAGSGFAQATAHPDPQEEFDVSSFFHEHAFKEPETPPTAEPAETPPPVETPSPVQTPALAAEAPPPADTPLCADTLPPTEPPPAETLPPAETPQTPARAAEAPPPPETPPSGPEKKRSKCKKRTGLCGRKRRRSRTCGFTLHDKSYIMAKYGPEAIMRLSFKGKRLSVCWEDCAHKLFSDLGVAQEMGLTRKYFRDAYDDEVDTPDWFMIAFATQHQVRLNNVTKLLDSSGVSREQALVSLTAGYFIVRVRIVDAYGDVEFHTFYFDAYRRHLLNNWPTSKVVEFDAGDATSAEAARDAIKHTDYAFLRSMKVLVDSVYQGLRE